MVNVLHRASGISKLRNARPVLFCFHPLQDHETRFPSTIIPCDSISLPATGNHVKGALLKDGQAGTTIRKVMAVPARPIHNANVMFCKK